MLRALLRKFDPMDETVTEETKSNGNTANTLAKQTPKLNSSDESYFSYFCVNHQLFCAFKAVITGKWLFSTSLENYIWRLKQIANLIVLIRLAQVSVIFSIKIKQNEN